MKPFCILIIVFALQATVITGCNNFAGYVGSSDLIEKSKDSNVRQTVPSANSELKQDRDVSLASQLPEGPQSLQVKFQPKRGKLNNFWVLPETFLNSERKTSPILFSSDLGELYFADFSGVRSIFKAKKGSVLAVSYDWQYLAVGFESQLSIYELPEIIALNGKKNASAKHQLPLFDHQILALEFVHNSPSILISGSDAHLYRWKFELAANISELEISSKGKTLEVYSGPASLFDVITSYPNGRIAFVGDWLGNLHVWLFFDQDRFAGSMDQNSFGPQFFTEETAHRQSHTSSKASITKLIIDDAGSKILLGQDDGSLEIWKVRGFKKDLQILAHQGAIRALDMKEDQILSCSREGTMKLWKIEINSVAPSSTLLKETEVDECRQIRHTQGKFLVLTKDGLDLI